MVHLGIYYLCYELFSSTLHIEQGGDGTMEIINVFAPLDGGEHRFIPSK